jgi:cytochrome b561
MNESISYYVGFGVGILAVAITMMVIRTMQKHRGVQPGDYDERQQLQRGAAAQRAYLALLLLLCVNGIVSGVLGVYWAKPGVDCFLCMFASVAVFVVECIRRDAYFTVKQTPRSGIRIFAIVTLCQVPATVMHAVDGAFIENGQLTTAAIYPACMVVFAIVLVAILLKRRSDKEEDEE